MKINGYMRLMVMIRGFAASFALIILAAGFTLFVMGLSKGYHLLMAAIR